MEKMQPFDELIEEHEFLIRRVIAKLNIYDNKEDYMQVGRLAIWQAAQDFDETKGEFGMYVYARIRFAILRALTIASKVTRGEVVVASEKMQFVMEQQGYEDVQLHMMEWYQLLTKEEEQMIRALYVKGLTLQQFADEIGIPHETVKKRKQRLMKKLKKAVEN